MNIEYFFNVEEHSLIAKVPLKVIINLDDHKELEDLGDVYSVIGILNVCEDSDTGNCIETPFLFRVNVNKDADVQVDKDNIIITYKPGDVVISAEYKELEADIQSLKAIIENRIKFANKNISQHIETIYTVASTVLGHWPITYIEIIESELYRCPDKPALPERLCDKVDYSSALPVDFKKAIHLRANPIRSIAYGYSKEGLATSLSMDEKHHYEDNILKATKPITKEQE